MTGMDGPSGSWHSPPGHHMETRVSAQKDSPHQRPQAAKLFSEAQFAQECFRGHTSGWF